MGGLRVGQIGEITRHRADAHNGQLRNRRGVEAPGAGVRGVKGQDLGVVRVSGVAEREQRVGVEKEFQASTKARTSVVLSTRTPGRAFAIAKPVVGSVFMNAGKRRKRRGALPAGVGFFLAATAGISLEDVTAGHRDKSMSVTKAGRGVTGSDVKTPCRGGTDILVCAPLTPNQTQSHRQECLYHP
jgi:hypothetical protein